MVTNVHLTPELESFTHGCVESGRYSDVSDVIQSALRLLQEGEERRALFNSMLDAARKETERDGGYTLEHVIIEADRIIEEASRS
ncbi:MAG: type II toxin-antitoxin system ParD family antitoxin [Magnetococcus sp. DMHC-1]|nr:type II toxin-antitoxin system ParD family antitoxin [Magnetococcales bacterium]